MRTPPSPEMTCGFSNITGILPKKKKKETMWFIGVEVEKETSAPPPKKNPGYAPEMPCNLCLIYMVGSMLSNYEKIQQKISDELQS